jgi:hypothetical protein
MSGSEVKARVLSSEEAEALKHQSQKVETPPKTEIEFSVDELIKFGTITKEVEIVPGLKVTLKTLTEAEREAALKLIKEVQLEENLLVKSEIMKRPILVMAIEKINSASFNTPETKAALLQKMTSLQSLVVDVIYLEYQKLLNEQYELLQGGLKKKS